MPHADKLHDYLFFSFSDFSLNFGLGTYMHLRHHPLCHSPIHSLCFISPSSALSQFYLTSILGSKANLICLKATSRHLEMVNMYTSSHFSSSMTAHVSHTIYLLPAWSSAYLYAYTPAWPPTYLSAILSTHMSTHILVCSPAHLPTCLVLAHSPALASAHQYACLSAYLSAC